MLKEFGIKSESFALLEAFKKESEKLGAEYHTVFNAFTEEKFKDKEGMFFAQAIDGTWSLRSEEQEGKILFALTGSICLAPNLVFTLPEQWNEGIAAIKNLVTDSKKVFNPKKIYGYDAKTKLKGKCKLHSIDELDNVWAFVSCENSDCWAESFTTAQAALDYVGERLMVFDDVKEFGKWLAA
jgi:hypothetical protein